MQKNPKDDLHEDYFKLLMDWYGITEERLESLPSFITHEEFTKHLHLFWRGFVKPEQEQTIKSKQL